MVPIAAEVLLEFDKPLARLNSAIILWVESSSQTGKTLVVLVRQPKAQKGALFVSAGVQHL